VTRGPAANETVTGVGLGLRWEFLDELCERTDAGEASGVDFLEISPENYMRRGGKLPAALARLGERYPIVTHGLTLSLGGSDPIDAEYVRELAAIVRAVRSPWHSDHMCFGAVGRRAMHDLLPVAFKRASIGRIADRIRGVRDVLGVPVAVENISYYWHPGRADLGEAEFLSAVCEAADCGLLLDVNNAYVNATNFGFDLGAWMRAAPLERAVQIHVAGHEWLTADERGLGGACRPGDDGALIIDTHGAPVCDPVLAALREALRRTGPVPVVLERDQNVPALDELLAEVATVARVTAS
jgi:uncharacterized protein